MLYFENDYCEGAHPAILQKLTETNFEKVSGYGTDPYCASAKEKIRAACACPEQTSSSSPAAPSQLHRHRLHAPPLGGRHRRRHRPCGRS